MAADGAHLGGLGAHMQVAADGALPHGGVAALEDLTGVDAVHELVVTGLVGLLDGAYQLELSGDLVEALLLGLLGELGVHLSPLH